MKLFLIKILFRLLRSPIGKGIDQPKISEWLGLQYPLKSFRDYISTRDMILLQMMGEGQDRESYLLTLGQRMELGKLLTEAKNNFERAEKIRRKKIEDENAKNKKT